MSQIPPCAFAAELCGIVRYWIYLVAAFSFLDSLRRQLLDAHSTHPSSTAYTSSDPSPYRCSGAFVEPILVVAWAPASAEPPPPIHDARLPLPRQYPCRTAASRPARGRLHARGAASREPALSRPGAPSPRSSAHCSLPAGQAWPLELWGRLSIDAAGRPGDVMHWVRARAQGALFARGH